MTTNETVVFLIYVHLLKYGHTVKYMLAHPLDICHHTQTSLDTAEFLNRYVND
jgi:hypothetical protein